MVGLYIKRILTINIYILTFKLDELFYLFYISDSVISVLHFFDPLSAFVFYMGCFFKVVQRLLHGASRTGDPAAVAAIPPVIGEQLVTPRFEVKQLVIGPYSGST